MITSHTISSQVRQRIFVSVIDEFFCVLRRSREAVEMQPLDPVTIMSKKQFHWLNRRYQFLNKNVFKVDDKSWTWVVAGCHSFRARRATNWTQFAFEFFISESTSESQFSRVSTETTQKLVTSFLRSFWSNICSRARFCLMFSRSIVNKRKGHLRCFMRQK